ncbi:MAG TPA: cation-translocating P-type ATPase, partial [Holophaga sp.]|nr:cation-translocating P-type ATPase [Holophaga sp.]
MSRRTFRVEGMTCASCVRRVEKALAAVPGVADVAVNLATEEATLDCGTVPPERLAEVLEARGYRLVLEAEPAPELNHALLRAVAAWALALPLMAGMVPGLHLHLSWPLQAVLSALAAFGAGWPFFLHAGRQALHGETSMDTLIALGASVSWGFGLHEGLQGSMHPPFETAAALVAFLLVGKYLEAKARYRATDALEALLKLAPEKAFRLKDDGSEEEVPSSALMPGDRVRVKPGGAVPVDGQVLSGQADVEEALLTGEPLPVPKGPGDALIAGALVHGGALEVRVDSVGRQTWLAKLGRQVADAQGSRAPVQDLADRISAVFVPAILILAGLTLAGWWLHTGQLAHAWRPAVTLLVIACPCALGLATPVAMAAALGTAARQGLLVRDAAALERLSRVTDLALDKTGTLTEGKPSVRDIRPLAGQGPEETLRLAVALERGSEHPLARGIQEAAKGLACPEVEGFRAHPGGGVTGTVEGRSLRLGSAAFLGLAFPEIPLHATAVGLAEGDRLLGILVLGDALRPETAATVRALSALGLRLHLFSGDRPEAVEAVARDLGIAEALGG